MIQQIFISHSHEDEAAYSSLCLILDNAGVLRWDVSKLSLGKPLTEGLRIAIDECDICIFVATPRSLESRWCLAELGAFWGAGKKVIIFIADPKIIESELPPQFRGNLWTSNAKQLINAIHESVNLGPVQKTSNGYCTKFGAMTINVNFGRIEEPEYGDDCLVVLPANEYFDDDCINDPESALGAFMQHRFKENISDIQALVKQILANEPSEVMEKEPGNFVPSYGVGKCVLLDSPLSSNLRIAMVSVTTQRSNVGLRGDVAYLFKAAESLQKVIANHPRLKQLFIPILGSGHGGQRGEISLVCMLIAFAELHRKSGNNLKKEINIIVFRRDQHCPPSISEMNIKSALNFAARFFAD